MSAGREGRVAHRQGDGIRDEGEQGMEVWLDG